LYLFSWHAGMLELDEVDLAQLEKTFLALGSPSRRAADIPTLQQGLADLDANLVATSAYCWTQCNPQASWIYAPVSGEHLHRTRANSLQCSTPASVQRSHETLLGRDHQYGNAISAGNTKQQASLGSDHPIRLWSLSPYAIVLVYHRDLVSMHLSDGT